MTTLFEMVFLSFVCVILWFVIVNIEQLHAQYNIFPSLFWIKPLDWGHCFLLQKSDNVIFILTIWDLVILMWRPLWTLDSFWNYLWEWNWSGKSRIFLCSSSVKLKWTFLPFIIVSIGVWTVTAQMDQSIALTINFIRFAIFS